GVNLGGGYHHARPGLGHGFCVYNDVAVALAALRAAGELDGPVLIVDTDAHQGDGDHAFFAEDPDTFSLSLHQGSLFPEPKLVGDADVELRAGDGDAELLAALTRQLDRLLPQSGPPPEPWALVVHVAGADVLSDDPLANLSMSPEGLAARDRLVLERARAQGVPLLHLLAGGYGPSAAAAQAESVAGLLEAISPGS
ncbi:MAG: histone deacetylase, partial [Alphaproteobacteria bacterium]|nr:histone deacetylase [Alphaproteobacteria bacterium]